MATHKVRVSMQPDVELEVSDEEKLDLERQGLLVEGKAASAVAPTNQGRVNQPTAEKEK